MLNLDLVRSCFPALRTDWALFDNAGGSAPSAQVVERVRRYMEEVPFQLGASYALSGEAADRVHAGRQAMARWIGARSTDEVVLGPSSTLLVRLLAEALAADFGPGDEVVVTDADHEANIGPWRALARQGVQVREWRCDPESGALRLEDLEALLSERTRLVACTHVSNVVGAIHDVRAVARRAHAVGALVVVDGVAYAPHRRVDVRALEVDVYFLSLYKTYGPHLGLLWGRREVLERAANVNHFFVGPDAVPAKLEPGNPCYELAASLPGIVEYLEAIAPAGDGDPLDRAADAITRHEERLVAPLIEHLAAHPRVRLLGPTTADAAVRVPTVSFSVSDRPASAIPPVCDAERVALRYGHFYAYRLIEALGLGDSDGAVRASLVHYNTPEEVARLIAALDRAL